MVSPALSNSVRPIRFSSDSANGHLYRLRTSFAQTATRAPRGGAPTPLLLTAHSVEFVALPSQARELHSNFPAEIDAALHDVPGYSGCLILVPDEEARLVTVITLWSGPDRGSHCRTNTKWVKKLLTRYVEHWLRVRTLATSFSLTQQFHAMAAAPEAPTSVAEPRSDAEVGCAAGRPDEV